MDKWGWILYGVPKNLVSFVVGILVSLPLPDSLRIKSMRWFANRYNINMDEAEKPLEEYKSINDLFTRKLKEGVRPVDQEAVLVHPADSEITVMNTIQDKSFLQVKGITYSYETIIENDFVEPGYYEGGQHLTYYLCPTDYHRVHSPVDGEIIGYSYHPGRLWPVNPWSVENISQLFAVNERVTVWIKNHLGTIGVTLVGATNVGKMTLAFEKDFATNNKHFRKKSIKKYDTPIKIKKGDKLGTFNMGSTVLLFLPKNIQDLTVKKLPKKVNYGQTLKK